MVSLKDDFLLLNGVKLSQFVVWYPNVSQSGIPRYHSLISLSITFWHGITVYHPQVMQSGIPGYHSLVSLGITV